jgi:hypothetical protein
MIGWKEFGSAMIFIALPMIVATALGISAGWVVMNYPGVSGFVVGIFVMAASCWSVQALLDKLSRRKRKKGEQG